MDGVKLKAHGLYKSFGNIKALEDVNLEVRGGELLALVGPNGAGKSTLLRRLSSWLKGPGAVYLDGKRLEEMPLRLLAQRLAMLEQEISPDLTFKVAELVAFGRYPHLSRFQALSPQDLARVRNFLGRLGVAHLAERTYRELSGGERRKVLLAMVLAQEAEIYLLDEPTAHLDVAYQLEIMKLLRDLAGEGKAVVCAMHDLNLASSFAHRMALMFKGRIMAQGSPNEVLTEENLRLAFGVNATIVKDPSTGRPHVIFAI